VFLSIAAAACQIVREGLPLSASTRFLANIDPAQLLSRSRLQPRSHFEFRGKPCPSSPLMTSRPRRTVCILLALQPAGASDDGAPTQPWQSSRHAASLSRDLQKILPGFLHATVLNRRRSHETASPSVPKAPADLGFSDHPCGIIDKPSRPPATENTSIMTSPFGNVNPFGGGDNTRGSLSPTMQRLVEEDESDTLASPTTPHFGRSGAPFSVPFSFDGAASAPPPEIRSPPNPESYPGGYNFARRTSVSAESLKPSADTDDNWSPPFYHKTLEQIERLKSALQDNFLFAHLDEEQYAQVLGALVEKPIPAKDIRVCCLISPDGRGPGREANWRCR
jgi:hypothetical protein